MNQRFRYRFDNLMSRGAPMWSNRNWLPHLSEPRNTAKSYGVRTNPRKSEQVTFAPEDKIIVIAEE